MTLTRSVVTDDAGFAAAKGEGLDGTPEGAHFLCGPLAADEGVAEVAGHQWGLVRLLKAQTARTGVLFGSEAQGLSNDHIALCDAIMTYPVNPAFASLNLAQAVIVFAAAWGDAEGREGRFEGKNAGVDVPASREELIGMFEHFEYELERAGYFYPPDKTPLMTRNLRNAFIR